MFQVTREDTLSDLYDGQKPILEYCAELFKKLEMYEKFLKPHKWNFKRKRRLQRAPI